MSCDGPVPSPSEFTACLKGFKKEPRQLSLYSEGLWAGLLARAKLVFTPALGPTQPPIQWAPEAISPGVKQTGCEADHSLPSSAKAKNVGAIPPLLHTSSWRGA
jgi:hypothetical protein